MKINNRTFKEGLKKMAIVGAAALMATTVASADPGAIQTELNGNRIHFDQRPVLQDGRVMVPLRGIFESLGADVLYTPSTKTIKASSNGRTVELALGQREAFVNGQQMFLDVPAGTIEGRTMVPLRFVSEAMGADVKWRSATRTVAISGDGPASDQMTQSRQPDIPAPPKIAQEPPRISQLVHNGRRTMVAGETLTVTMLGEPESKASFGILGTVKDVPMTEVSPGRYEGKLAITRGFDVHDGTLVATMKKNNKESLKEAERGVTIVTRESLPLTNERLQVMSPASGTVVNSSRPLIETRFTESIRPGTATLSINGNRYTPMVRPDSRTIAFQPYWDLAEGTKRVQVQALTQDGRMLTRDWDFRVEGQQLTPTVSVSNLTTGASVPPVFNVEGRTVPNARVQIETTASRSVLSGLIGVRGQTTKTTTRADGTGYYRAQLDTSNLPTESQLDIRVSVVNNDGKIEDSVELDLTRQ